MISCSAISYRQGRYFTCCDRSLAWKSCGSIRAGLQLGVPNTICNIKAKQSNAMQSKAKKWVPKISLNRRARPAPNDVQVTELKSDRSGRSSRAGSLPAGSRSSRGGSGSSRVGCRSSQPISRCKPPRIHSARVRSGSCRCGPGSSQTLLKRHRARPRTACRCHDYCCPSSQRL